MSKDKIVKARLKQFVKNAVTDKEDDAFCTLDDDMKSLINNGTIDINQNFYFNATILHSIAYRSRNIEDIKFLVEKNADLNQNSYDDETSFHYLARNKYVTLDMVKYLLKHGGDVSVRNKYGSTPLHFISLNEDIKPEIVKCIIDNSSNINVINDFGATPIHCLAIYNNSINNKIIKLFLDEGADINAQRNEGSTPFNDYLKSNGNINTEIVEFLMQNGAIININDFHLSFKSIIKNLSLKVDVEDSNQLINLVFGVLQETLFSLKDSNNNINIADKVASDIFEYINKTYKETDNTNEKEICILAGSYFSRIYPEIDIENLDKDFVRDILYITKKSSMKAFYPSPIEVGEIPGEFLTETTSD